MDKLMEKVKKELENIGEKGLSTANLETAYKLIDIYKDIKESEYYETQTNERSYDARMRDSRGRFMEDGYNEGYNGRGEWEATGRYGTDYSARGGGRGGYNAGGGYNFGPMDRHMMRLEDEMDNYNASRSRYREGGSSERVAEGMEMIMKAIHSLVEGLCDYAETSQEKEIIRKHIDKMKSI